jgi:uncharacterized membrane protein required for colicin V production
MLIWLLTLLLFALFATLGYFKGAIRMIFPLLGLFLGIMLALPLAPVVQPLIPKVGLENPIWSYLLPPVVVFLLIEIIFVGVGFFGHAKVNLFYKYRTDDTHRMSWERLNQRLGVCMGVLAGTIYTILIGVVVYVLGYLTVQVTPDGETSAVKYLNRAKVDLHSSGLDRFAAVFDPAPEWYYEASDILGLLYHNPALHTRLASYPPFISLSESPDFQEFASDTEFLGMLATQPSAATLLGHPKIQTILGSRALLERLSSIDLEDLGKFLRSGVSEKFQDPPILGRWEVDPYWTFLMEKKRNLDMTAADVRLLRYQREFIRGFKLYVMPDNQVKLKGPDVSGLIGRLEEIEKAVRGGRRTRPPVTYINTAPAATTQSGVTGISAESERLMQDRYGVSARAPQPTQPAPQMIQVQPQTSTPAVPAPPTTDELAAEIAQLEVVTLAEGTWSDDTGRLIVKLRPRREMSQFLVTRRIQEGVYASVREERLYLTDKRQTMVMARF